MRQDFIKDKIQDLTVKMNMEAFISQSTEDKLLIYTPQMTENAGKANTKVCN